MLALSRLGGDNLLACCCRCRLWRRFHRQTWRGQRLTSAWHQVDGSSCCAALPLCWTTPTSQLLLIPPQQVTVDTIQPHQVSYCTDNPNKSVTVDTTPASQLLFIQPQQISYCLYNPSKSVTANTTPTSQLLLIQPQQVSYCHGGMKGCMVAIMCEIDHMWVSMYTMTYKSVCVSINMHIWMWKCVCVCVRERLYEYSSIFVYVHVSTNKCVFECVALGLLVDFVSVVHCFEIVLCIFN